MKKIKILTIILAIILISMVGFVGVYVKEQNRMENQVKDYSLLSNLSGERTVRLTVNKDSEEIIKDAEGNVVETEEELTDEQLAEKGYTKESVPNNSQEVLNVDNYNKTKEVIEKRLKRLGVQEYEITVDENTGDIILRLPENSNTNTIISNIYTVGKFEIVDSETEEVLINNDDIKDVSVMYGSTGTTASTGTSVYLQIEFNKEGTKKLETVSTTYSSNSVDSNTTETNTAETNSTNTNSTDANTTTENTTANESTDNTTNTENTAGTDDSSTTSEPKEVTLRIDDTEMMTTSFDEPMRTGKMQLTVGTSTTDTSTLNDNLNRASNIAAIIGEGNLPIEYDVTSNEYILTDITEQQVLYVLIAILIIAILGILVWIFRFKLMGLLSGFAYIGLVAIYLLIIRYTNVAISLEGAYGILVILILNYIFINMLLKKIKNQSKKPTKEEVNIAEKETFKEFFIKIVPICIAIVVFCFIQWTPISSFGMVMFWGIALIAIYNYIVTDSLLKIKADK